MSLDSHADGRFPLALSSDPNAWLFNCYLLGLKRRNPWFLVACSYIATVSARSPSRGLRDFEFDRHWHEIEAVFRFRRRISFDEDEIFDSVFPFRQLLEEATSFTLLSPGDLAALLAIKSRDSLELRFEHFSEFLKDYPRATFEDLISAMTERWLSQNRDPEMDEYIPPRTIQKIK